MGELIGNERIAGLLHRTAEERKPAHAYLFNGPEGVGKKRFAIQFACLLNCPERGEDADHHCPVCRRITESKHPDVLIESPERGNIRIERIRSLQAFFKYAPVEAAYRVAIIDDAHCMNRAAQNALLKTLEEPPPNRILILVTGRPSSLLSTVRSRCRKAPFGPIDTDPLGELLRERLGITREKAAALAAMSGGSVSRALEMEASNFAALRDLMVSALSEPGGTGLKGLLELSVKISRDRDTLRQAIDIASAWIRDLIVTQVAPATSEIINRDLLDRISSGAQHHDPGKLMSVYGELARASELVEADINVNRTLITDVLLLKTTRILGGPTLGLDATAWTKE